jgi:hypothetical protein
MRIFGNLQSCMMAYHKLAKSLRTSIIPIIMQRIIILEADLREDFSEPKWWNTIRFSYGNIDA